MAYDKALVDKASAETGVPADLLERVIAAESSGNPRAVSPKGAEGLMQLEPAAASDEGVSDRFDPGQNIMGGAKYLKTRYTEFGSWPLAAAAYVSGPETVKKAGGVPLMWPDRHHYGFPPNPRWRFRTGDWPEFLIVYSFMLLVGIGIYMAFIRI